MYYLYFISALFQLPNFFFFMDLVLVADCEQWRTKNSYNQ